jgi:hypothetical protein
MAAPKGKAVFGLEGRAVTISVTTRREKLTRIDAAKITARGARNESR